MVAKRVEGLAVGNNEATSRTELISAVLQGCCRLTLTWQQQFGVARTDSTARALKLSQLELIDDSYDLVVAGLPRVERLHLGRSWDRLRVRPTGPESEGDEDGRRQDDRCFHRKDRMEARQRVRRGGGEDAQ